MEEIKIIIVVGFLFVALIIPTLLTRLNIKRMAKVIIWYACVGTYISYVSIYAPHLFKPNYQPATVISEGVQFLVLSAIIGSLLFFISNLRKW